MGKASILGNHSIGVLIGKSNWSAGEVDHDTKISSIVVCNHLLVPANGGWG